MCVECLLVDLVSIVGDFVGGGVVEINVVCFVGYDCIDFFKFVDLVVLVVVVVVDDGMLGFDCM